MSKQTLVKKLCFGNLSCKMTLSMSDLGDVTMKISKEIPIELALSMLTDGLVEIYMQEIEPYPNTGIDDFANTAAKIIKDTYRYKNGGRQ